MTNETEPKERILVSACLLGDNVRYDGGNNLIDNLDKLQERYEIIPVCPEIIGGLVTPRIPSEIKSFNPLTIENEFGIDTLDFFTDGAMQTLNICQKYNIKIALLKSKSPSCGIKEVYDGTFTKTLMQGQGITANILAQHNIRLYDENQIGELI